MKGVKLSRKKKFFCKDRSLSQSSQDFEVPFKRLFAPTSPSRMSNIFRDSESLWKSYGKKLSQNLKKIPIKGVKSLRKKKVFFSANSGLLNSLIIRSIKSRFYGIDATIRIGQEMLCLPYAGFLLNIFPKKVELMKLYIHWVFSGMSNTLEFYYYFFIFFLAFETFWGDKLKTVRRKKIISLSICFYGKPQQCTMELEGNFCTPTVFPHFILLFHSAMASFHGRNLSAHIAQV